MVEIPAARLESRRAERNVATDICVLDRYNNSHYTGDEMQSKTRGLNRPCSTPIELSVVRENALTRSRLDASTKAPPTA